MTASTTTSIEGPTGGEQDVHPSAGLATYANGYVANRVGPMDDAMNGIAANNSAAMRDLPSDRPVRVSSLERRPDGQYEWVPLHHGAEVEASMPIDDLDSVEAIGTGGVVVNSTRRGRDRLGCSARDRAELEIFPAPDEAKS